MPQIDGPDAALVPRIFSDDDDSRNRCNGDRPAKKTQKDEFVGGARHISAGLHRSR